MAHSFCETVWASGHGKWHIRKLTDKGRKLGGGADTPSLCETVVAWDLEVELTQFHIDKNTCEECMKHYLEETNGSDIRSR